MRSPFDIIYEDNHLLAVNKPAGMLTQPTETESESLETLLKAWIKEKYQKPGNVFLGTIHRLDRPVSGLVLFAKTSKALSRLNESIRSKEMKKTYCALVEKAPPKEKDTLKHFLKHDEYRASVCDSKDKEGKPAILHYEILKQDSGKTLLQIDLETGRYHQIRAQLSAIGCPIIGDVKYGSHIPWPKGLIALHHFRLRLKHPVTDAPLILEAPLPDYFS